MRIVSTIRRLVTLALLVSVAWRVGSAGAQEPRLQYGDRVTGEIAAGSGPDVWQFGGGAGDRVTIRLERLDGDVVPGLRVRNAADQIVLDIGWPESSEPGSEVTLRLETGGEHAIEVSARQGAGTYALSLILAQAGSADARLDIALSYGQTIEGELSGADDFDAWSFRGEAGDVVDAMLAPADDVSRPVVTLVSPTGSTLAAGATLSAVRLPMGGIYTLDVRAADDAVGAYRLALRLRSSPVADTEFLAAPLELGMPLRGRLTSDAPAALYRVTASGALAVALDLAAPNARVEVAVLTENRAVLDSLTGIGRLHGTIAPGGRTSVWLEVVSPDVAANRPIDFELQVDPLRRAGRDTRALVFGAVQRATPSTEADVWLLDGQAGDLIELSLAPDVSSASGLLQLYSPRGDLLLQRRVNAGFSQPLLLEQTGLYEVVIQSLGDASYTITAERTGLDGGAFDLILDHTERGLLGTGPSLAASSEVAAHAGEVWMVDIDQAGRWAFELAGPVVGAPLALRVEAPDGSSLAQAVTLPLSGWAALDWQIETPGRYRVVVLNPGAEGAAPYTVRAAPTGGGRLSSGEMARGVLLAAQPEHRWVLDVAAPATIRVELDALAGDALPQLTLAQPDGSLVPLAPLGPATPNILVARAEQSGEHTLRARLPEPSTSASYRLQLTMESAQDAATSPAIGPADYERLIATPEPIAAPVRVDPRAEILPATRPGPDVLASAQPLAVGSTARGAVPASANYQVWRFQAESGQRVALTTVGLAQGPAPDLTLLDEQGAVLARSFAPEQVSNTLLHRFAADGRYYVVVRYEMGGRYLLRAQDRSALDDSLSGVLAGRTITYGETIQGELLSQSAVEHAYFYAHAGDALRARAGHSAGAGGIVLRLETLSGAVLAESAPDPARPERVALDFRIVNEGVYRLSLQPVGEGAPGEYRLHLTLSGSPATTRDGGRLEGEVYGTLSSEDPSDTWLFTATAGEQVSIAVEAGSDGLLPLGVELTDTAGAAFLREDTLVGAPAIALERISLPRTGVYRLVIRAERGGSGLYRAQLVRSAGHPSGTQRALPLNQTVSRVLTEADTLDVWTFAGSQGDLISAEARTIRGDPALLSFQIRTQNGAVLVSVPGDASGRAAAPQILLPETGHYTLAIGNLSAESNGALAYELTVLLESTQARSMGAVLLSGGRGAGSLSGSDLRDVWLFEGRQGDVVWVEVAAQGGGVAASVLTTDWHTASTAGRPSMLAVGDRDEAGVLALEPVVLPADGVYTVDVSTAPGSAIEYTVRLTVESASALAAALVVPPQRVEGQISSEDRRAAWAFEAQQGDTLALRVAPDSRATLAPALTLYGPDGDALLTAHAGPGEVAAPAPFSLPESGVYTVAVGRRLDAFGGTEGRFRLDITLEPAPAVPTRLLRYEQVGRSWINNSSPVETWTFDGEAGDVIEARLDVLSGTLDPLLRLIGPGGDLLATSARDADSALQIRHRLETTGSYRIEVARRGGAVGPTQGNYALALNRVYRFSPLPTGRVIAYGQRVIETVDAEAPLDQWAFVGAAGDMVLVSVRFPGDDAPLALSLTDPSGTTLATGTRAGSRTTIDGLTLPFGGVYLLEVRQSADTRSAFSPYELELSLVGSVGDGAASGGLLAAGQPVYGRFGEAPQAHVWLLRAARGDRLALSLARLEGALAVDLTLLAPDGTIMLHVAPLPGAASLTTGPVIFQDEGLYAAVIAAHHEALGLSYRFLAAPMDVVPGAAEQD